MIFIFNEYGSCSTSISLRECLLIVEEAIEISVDNGKVYLDIRKSSFVYQKAVSLSVGCSLILHIFFE